MKKILPLLLVFSFTVVLFSCGNPPPDQLFARVVLNTNLLFGFAGAGMQRELASPSVKLVDEKTMATAPMKRTEVVTTKLETVEANFEKVKAIGSNEETKDMLTATIALYEFVIPVYQNEYAQLAKLYDEGAPAEQIAALEKTIQEKYGARFEELYNAVGATGKVYAAKHNIPVKEVNPAPRRAN
jgi:hypothetical protein